MNKSKKPIFILGLPRSGSTVTEAILSSANKNIITLGESSIINGIIAKDFSTTENLLLDLNLMTEKVIEILVKEVNTTLLLAGETDVNDLDNGNLY